MPIQTMLSILITVLSLVGIFAAVKYTDRRLMKDALKKPYKIPLDGIDNKCPLCGAEPGLLCINVVTGERITYRTHSERQVKEN